MFTTRVKRLSLSLASVCLTGALAIPATANAQVVQDQRYYEPSERNFTASVRVQVEPRDAEVYVDGQFAGRVDNFDGFFQRLRVTPGNHRIVLWRPGYHIERHQLYFDRNTTRVINGRMQPLRPGQAQPPRPGNRPGPRPGYDPYDRYDDRYDDRIPAGRLGTVSLYVAPGDAEILVNGSRRSWQRLNNRFALNLEPGRHRIEVRRAGYAPYAQDVVIRAGATVSVNVTLRRGF